MGRRSTKGQWTWGVRPLSLQSMGSESARVALPLPAGADRQVPALRPRRNEADR
jgi:hypothetical protein